MLNEDLTSTLCLKNTTTRARLCDTCHLRPGTIFCEADLAYLCTACDLHVHAANKLSSRHKRVRVCDACEQAPAAFICKADAASLCTTCDAVIHSANPLSRRHHRVPVMPILGSSVYNNNNNNNEPWSVIGLGFQPQDSADQATLDHHNHQDDEDEAASWLIFHDSPPKNNGQGQGQSQTNEFVSNGDEYLELVDYNSCQDTQFSDDLKFDDDNMYIHDGIHNNIPPHQQQPQPQQQQRYGGCDADSLVPVQKYHQLHHHHHHHHNFQNQKFQLGMDYETSNGGYGYSASLGDSVCLLSYCVKKILFEKSNKEVSNCSNNCNKGARKLWVKICGGVLHLLAPARPD
ncbi:putative transcription factor interactor and regulator Znf-B family [Helianthus debilis subsp. tardiflorus]